MKQGCIAMALIVLMIASCFIVDPRIHLTVWTFSMFGCGYLLASLARR